ncbi:signal peptide-containing protein [Theileria equi strain WA]|uniref:Signal peptide-containing protein n=1 Tax=Theileria equi strain WA TaxID=1537102 RepID=L0AY66_THEEQ|nr:signal peptide-containing protein [Theileria equi strain WA]AFZ79941.1 signal peptide-containing protein [Theileria equi strain WA]|eukprot:XP_004829607.1 signal peptide-containing protein [Theileria equi strain WA]
MELLYALFILHAASVIAFRAHFNPSRDKFAVFAKNSYFDIKKRFQRRARRLKQIIPPTVRRLDRMEENAARYIQKDQKVRFGERLSQIPGDGGMIPGLKSTSNAPEAVVNYYKSYFFDKKKRIPCELDKNYDLFRENEWENIQRIIRDPQKTFGCFEGKEPVMNEPFYKPMEKFEPNEEYKRATFRKLVKKTVTVEIPEKLKRNQGYYGLVVESIFSKISKEEMDRLRLMEINMKMGNYKYDKNIYGTDDDDTLEELPTM